MEKTWTQYRAEIAQLSQADPRDEAALIVARRNLRAARLELHVRTVLEGEPALTPDQLLDVADILVTAAEEMAAEAGV